MIKKDGFYQLEKDLEAVAEFEKQVQNKLMKFNSVIERIDYLFEHNYYYDVREQYSKTQIEEIHNLAYSYKFKYKSYMAISKFYKDYALKSNDKKLYLETLEDRNAIVALYLAQGDMERARRYVKAFMEQRYQPATPTYLNAGKARRGEMVSCFLLGIGDSLNYINFAENTARQLSKIGGGVSLDLSYLRGRDEEIKGIEHATKGVMPVAKLHELSFAYVDQMGQRKGSGSDYIIWTHSDVVEMLDSKRINSDERNRLKTLSIGLTLENKFFELAEKNLPYFTFYPYSVFKEYGIHLADMDMDEWYDKLVANPNVRKKSMDELGLGARDFLTKIAMTSLESGYPYLMFKTNANNQNPLKALGKIKMSNLCTEIFQIQELSVINDHGQEDIISRDVDCVLGSLNTVNVMENKAIEQSVYDGMDALTDVLDLTHIPNAPTINKAMRELNAVGLGMMNLHGYLAKNRIMYESAEARDFARTFAMSVNFYSLKRSMEIAKERKRTFLGFERSDYATGEYFTKYLIEDFSPRTEKVKALFEGMDIPSPVEWKELMVQVQEHGIYHAYRLATAPTQSISYLQNATSSVMPVVEQIESRTYGNATTYYPMPYMTKDNFFFYKSAWDMDMFKLLDLIAEIQNHVDQGISTILYVNSNISTRDLARYYIYANKIGLKSLYYTRTKLLSVAECTSCAV